MPCDRRYDGDLELLGFRLRRWSGVSMERADDTARRAPAATFERPEPALAADEDRAPLEALLIDGTQLGETPRGTLLDLMFDRRRAWRASSVWTDAGGEHGERSSP